MKRYELSPPARGDLSKIWLYTLEHWGAEQADRYVGDIRRHMEALSAGTIVATRYIYPGQDLLRSRGASHHIYFMDGPRAIKVIRILHEAQDVTRHL